MDAIAKYELTENEIRRSERAKEEEGELEVGNARYDKRTNKRTMMKRTKREWKA
jgi:hypothetical protein